MLMNLHDRLRMWINFGAVGQDDLKKYKGLFGGDIA